METFSKIIDALVWSTLLMSIAQLYLRTNKIWKRKHEREVAESQSLFGLSLLLLNCLIWIIKYILDQDYESILDTSLIMTEALVFILVGTGFWVKGQERLGIWKLIKQALKLERKEADYLIKRFFKPVNAESIINMLHQLAMIDNEMDPKEQDLLEKFAKEWNIDYDPDKLNQERSKGTTFNYMRLRKTLSDYLDIDPPREQVAQLRDMMNAIIHADEKVSEEEELITSELIGIINNYLEKDAKTKHYRVLIVPQMPEHDSMIRELLPESEKISISGGTAYAIGTYFSHSYAEMMCRQYRQIKLFTIVHAPEEEAVII